MTEHEINHLKKYCRKWGIDYSKEVDEKHSYDSNLSHLQKLVLDMCRTPDVVEITRLAKQCEEQLRASPLQFYASFNPGGVTVTQIPIANPEKLRFSLKTMGPTGKHGFSLLEWAKAGQNLKAKAEHPKNKDEDVKASRGEQ